MDLVESLFDACENGDLEKVKSLVEQGVNIHEEDDYALQLASEMGHLDIIDYIITNYGDKKSIKNVLFWSLGAGNFNDFPHLTKHLFSLYEDKEKAFEIILESLTIDNLSIVKDIIDQYDFNIDNKILETIEERLPSIHDYLKLSKEIKSTQNNMNFDIK